MWDHMGRRAIMAAIAVWSVALLPLPVAKAQSAGLGINPGRIELEMQSGGEKTVAFEVESPPSDTPVRGRLLLSVTDWTINQDGALLYANPGTLPASASDWVVFSPSAISIVSGQKHIVRVTTRVPAETAPGVYRTALFLQERPPAAPAQKGQHLVYLRFRYVFMLYVIVPPVEGRGDLVDASLEWIRGRTRLLVRARNEGSRHVRPLLNWFIRDAEGQLIDQQKRYEGTVILPSASIQELLPVKADFVPGRYDIRVEADFQDGRPVQSLHRIVELKAKEPAKSEGAQVPIAAMSRWSAMKQRPR